MGQDLERALRGVDAALTGLTDALEWVDEEQYPYDLIAATHRLAEGTRTALIREIDAPEREGERSDGH